MYKTNLLKIIVCIGSDGSGSTREFKDPALFKSILISCLNNFTDVIGSHKLIIRL